MAKKRSAVISRALKGGFKSGGTIGNISGGTGAAVSVKSTGGGTATASYSGIGTSSTGEQNRTIEDIQKAGIVEAQKADTRAEVFSEKAKETFNIEQQGDVFSMTIGGIKTSIKGNLPTARYTNYASGRRFEYVGSEVSGPESESLTLRPEFARGERYTPGRREATEAKTEANALYKAAQELRGYERRPAEEFGAILPAASGRQGTGFGGLLSSTYAREGYKTSEPETFMAHFYPYGTAKTGGIGFSSDVSRQNKEELGVKAGIFTKLEKIKGITDFYNTSTTALKTYPLTSELFLKENQTYLMPPNITAAYPFAPTIRAWSNKAESMPDYGFKDLFFYNKYFFNTPFAVNVGVARYEVKKAALRFGLREAADFSEQPLKYISKNLLTYALFKTAAPIASSFLTKATSLKSFGNIALSEKLSNTLVGGGFIGAWAASKVLERPEKFTRPAGYLEFGLEAGYYGAMFKGIGKLDKGKGIVSRVLDLKSEPFGVTTSPLTRADITVTTGEQTRIGYLKTKIWGITVKKTPVTVTDTMESLNQLVKYNRVSEKGYFKTTMTEGLPEQTIIGERFKGSATNRFNLVSTLSYYGKIRTTGAIKTSYDFPGYQRDLYLSSKRSSNYLMPSKGRQSPFLSGMLTQPMGKLVDVQAIGTSDVYRKNIFNMFTRLGKGKDLNEYTGVVDVNWKPPSKVKYALSLGGNAGMYDPQTDTIKYAITEMGNRKFFTNTLWHERQHSKYEFYTNSLGSNREILLKKLRTSKTFIDYGYRFLRDYTNALYDYSIPSYYEKSDYYEEVLANVAGEYFSMGKSSVSKKYPVLTRYFEATAYLKPYRLKPSSISTDVIMTNIIAPTGDNKAVDYWGRAGDFVIKERAKYNIKYGAYNIKLSGLASGRAIAIPESYPPRLNVRGQTIKYEGKVRGTRFNFYQETLGDIYQMEGYQKGFTQTASTLQMGRLSDKAIIDYVYTTKQIAPDITKSLVSGREVKGRDIKPAFTGYDYQIKLASVSDNKFTQTIYLTRGMKGTGANIISAIKQRNTFYPNYPKPIGRAIKTPVGKTDGLNFNMQGSSNIKSQVRQQATSEILVSRQGILKVSKQVATAQYLKKGFAPGMTAGFTKVKANVGVLENVAVGKLSPISGSVTENQILTTNLTQNLFSVSRLNNIQISNNVQIAQPIGKTINMTRLNAVTRQTNIQKQITKQTTVQTAVTIGVSVGKTAQKSPVFTVPTLTPPPDIPKFNFKFAPRGSTLGYKKRKSVNVIFNPKYFSSVEANVFKIRGKKPSWQSIATGLNIRPMVRI